MTTRINLLPWRDERRRLREREFYTMLGGAAIVGALGVIMWSMITGAAIDNQTARNAYLSGEIAEMDKRIEQITELDKTKARLVGRKNAIELLQANRSQMVHLFDELVVTVPDGVRLDGLKQVGDQLTLEGIAESNTRVATYMRNIDRSPWMGRSEVSRIENNTGMANTDPRLPYKFSLSVRLLKAGEQKSAEDIAAAAAAADFAEGIQLAPGDMRVTPAASADAANATDGPAVSADGTMVTAPATVPAGTAAGGSATDTAPTPVETATPAASPATESIDAPVDNPSVPPAPLPVDKPVSVPPTQEPSP